jgi:hypothetical protein
MTRAEILKRLTELYNMKEVSDGFASQQACLSWSNRVAPLLRFNQNYHETFLHHLQIISMNVSIYTAEPAFRIMVNQVEMAIEELRLDAGDEGDSRTAEGPNVVRQRANLFKFEPNFHGIGINMNEAFRRLKSWRKDRKS